MSARLETPEQARERLARASMTDRERAELWASIEHDTSQRTARRWLLPIVIAIASVAAAAALWLGVSEPTAPSEQVAALQRVDPCAIDASAGTLRLAERCASKVVSIAGDQWQLEQGAEVARVESGARVERGRIEFTVRPRKQPGDRPFIVKVSHAEVRVIGTVFLVDQQQGRGTVHVTEGVIEVIWHDGQRQRVAAGESASWPRPPPAPAPAPDPAASPADAGPRRAAKTVDLDAAMDRLLVLRSQKRFGEAVTLLRNTLATNGLLEPQRERISQELGFALEASGAPSCAHWAKHGETFKSRRAIQLVGKKLKSCPQQ
jgi:hypothetical protein